MQSYFVTGTDTDSGKTVVTQGLIKLAVERGFKTCGFKPVAAGCEKSLFGLRNQDAQKLMDCSNVDLSYQQVNPIAFEKPIAPHIAAMLENTTIALDVLNQAYCELKAQPIDKLFIEGAGGWRLPLGKGVFLPDW